VKSFRYDNAAHRPSLPQTGHKHTVTSVFPASAPTLAQALGEILEMRGEQNCRGWFDDGDSGEWEVAGGAWVGEGV